MNIADAITNWEYRRNLDIVRTIEMSQELAGQMFDSNERGASPEMLLSEIGYLKRQLEQAEIKIQKSMDVLGGLKMAQELMEEEK